MEKNLRKNGNSYYLLIPSELIKFLKWDVNKKVFIDGVSSIKKMVVTQK